MDSTSANRTTASAACMARLPPPPPSRPVAISPLAMGSDKSDSSSLSPYAAMASMAAETEVFRPVSAPGPGWVSEARGADQEEGCQLPTLCGEGGGGGAGLPGPDGASEDKAVEEIDCCGTSCGAHQPEVGWEGGGAGRWGRSPSLPEHRGPPLNHRAQAAGCGDVLMGGSAAAFTLLLRRLSSLAAGWQGSRAGGLQAPAPATTGRAARPR